MNTLALLCVLVTGAAIDAAAVVRAMTIGGETVEGEWSGVDGSGTIVLSGSSGPQRLPAEEVMHVRWPEPAIVRSAASRPADEVVVYLTDGSRLNARILDASADSIDLETALVPSLRLPIARLAGLRFAGHDDDPLEALAAFEQALARRDPAQDVLLILREGRVMALKGVIESLAPSAGGFRWHDRIVPILPETAFGLVFAAGVAPAPVPPVRCLRRDGSIWAGQLVGGDVDAIRLEVADGLKVRLPINELEEIRFHSDRVRFLSDLEPVSYEFTPFATTRWPYRRDRSVANRTMRIGDQSFDRGIGLHSASVLTYDVPEGFSEFAAVIGIDQAARPLGSVVFRVLADGREAFNSGPVTGRDEPRAILVPLDGARRLELRVDFGEDLDVGDQADWGNARLIK